MECDRRVHLRSLLSSDVVGEERVRDKPPLKREKLESVNAVYFIKVNVMTEDRSR